MSSAASCYNACQGSAGFRLPAAARDGLRRENKVNSHLMFLVGLASMAGGLLGLLAAWKRPPGKKNPVLEAGLLVSATAAFIVSFVLFAKAFGAHSPLYALNVTVLVTAWTAAVRTIIPLPLPGWFRHVRRGEWALLRQRWTGIKLFGRFLRRTALRHLGGSVYLSGCDNDERTVLQGIRRAEEVHVWAVCFSIPWLVWWSATEEWRSLGASLAVHLLLNIYPVLHLRLTRARLERCGSKLSGAVESKSMSTIKSMTIGRRFGS